MLFDIIDSYDQATITHLRSVWKGMILELVKEEDSKKILSFLGKCCVLGIDQEKQLVHVGIPNQFVESQVYKFFKKPLDKAVKNSFETQYSIDLVTHDQLQSGEHILQIDIKALLPVKEKPELLLEPVVVNQMKEYFGILFDPQYTFERFVAGAQTELAYSASQAIAAQPGEVYNPFFIYGDVGLGKTHLMQAIGNHIIEAFPDKVVLYLPTSTFIDKVIDAVRKGKLGDLKNKLEEVDVLMLDDIQFLAGKERTQEIFHTIFNDFYANKKQIVLTSDRPPKELTLLESRLQSRFALGLVADIKLPDLETRIAILQTKIKEKDIQLDARHIELIAQTVNTNVRELEGALNIVLTRVTLLKKEVTDKDVLEALATLGFSPTLNEIQKNNNQSSTPQFQSSATSRYEQIVTFIAQYYGLLVSDVTGPKRTKEVSRARQLCMYIAKKHFHRSLQKIGNFFDGKNHASVIYAISQCEKLLDEDSGIGDAYAKAVKKFTL